MATVQIRDVPDEVSRVLKARAAAEGRSLSDYLREEITRLADLPTRTELFARIDARGLVDVPPAAEVLAEERADRP